MSRQSPSKRTRRALSILASLGIYPIQSDDAIRRNGVKMECSPEYSCTPASFSAYMAQFKTPSQSKENIAPDHHSPPEGFVFDPAPNFQLFSPTLTYRNKDINNSLTFSLLSARKNLSEVCIL